jgi:hypothetical protein
MHLESENKVKYTSNHSGRVGETDLLTKKKNVVN